MQLSPATKQWDQAKSSPETLKKLVTLLKAALTNNKACELVDKNVMLLARLFEVLDYDQLLNIVPFLQNSQTFPKFRSKHMVAERRQQVSCLVFRLAKLQAHLEKWVLSKTGGNIPRRDIGFLSLLYKAGCNDTKAQRPEPDLLRSTAQALEKVLSTSHIHPKIADAGLDTVVKFTATKVHTILQMLVHWKDICTEPEVHLPKAEVTPYHMLAAFSIFEEHYEAEAAKLLNRGKVLSISVPPKIATTSKTDIQVASQAIITSTKTLDNFRMDLQKFLPSVEDRI